MWQRTKNKGYESVAMCDKERRTRAIKLPHEWQRTKNNDYKIAAMCDKEQRTRAMQLPPCVTKNKEQCL